MGDFVRDPKRKALSRIKRLSLFEEMGALFMKSNLLNMSLAIGIILLFITSAVTPMVIGNNADMTIERKNKDIDRLLEDLAFVCSDRYGSSKLEYYKQQLLQD